MVAGIAAVILVRQEADQDLHVALQSGSSHMIAEAPNAPTCTANATASRRQQMAAARSAVRLCARARVVGVAFWDFKHGQTKAWRRTQLNCTRSSGLLASQASRDDDIRSEA
jgi:hypothetical protein